MLMEEVLEGISVSEIMGHQVLSVAEDEPVERLIEEKFLHHKFTAYPVLNKEGYVVGVIDFRDIKKVPRDARNEKSVLEIMHLVPLSHLPRPTTHAFEALREMLSLGLAQLPVVDEDGKLAGIVTRTDIMSMFQIRSDLADEIVV
jgi:CBS domain-containing protein